MQFLTGWYVVCTLLCLANMATVKSGKLQLRSDDICGDYDGRRIYLELGTEGVLIAKNSTGVASKFTSTHHQCSLELITCPSCIISVKFKFLNISRNCGKNLVLDSCGCDYVWIYEPPFEDVSGEQFCGHFVNTNTSHLIYKSQTRATAINFLFSSHHEHAFTLEYTSERNRQFFDGYPNKYTTNNNTNQFVTSPFFPHFYPRDMNTEYIITCRNQVDTCRLRLIFTDFQLSTSSLIEFFDYNGQRISVITGSLFRPPLITTSGPKMVIRFYANGGTSLGFRASYNFLIGETNSTLKPDTDCGGYVDNLGGAITMMNMLTDNTKAYDCFWIIRPPDNFLHLKTQIYVKITTFSDFAGPTELTLRQGMTSNEPVVEALRHPSSQFTMVKQREHVVAIKQGFYISLKGLFRPESRLAIVYSAFNYKACYSGSDYLCRNMRCIPAYLVCDGFDHCGDNSDETTTCLQEPNERMRWTHRPNFFFPKNDKYSYLKTATIVFVVCSVGLMTLIFALVLILYRLNVRNRTHRHLQSHLQSINDMLVCTVILDEGVAESVVEEIIVPDEPPLYEAPPDYQSVLKSEKRSTKRQSRSSSRARSKHVLNTPTDSSALPRCTTPPPMYTSLPRIEITKVDEDATATASQSSARLLTYPFQARQLRKHLSLEEIHAPLRQRHLSLDNNRVKLYNATPETPVRLRRKRRFSEAHLLFLSPYHSAAFENAETGVRNLRRSVSIENLFTTV